MKRSNLIKNITRLAIYCLVVLFLACSIPVYAAPAQFFYDAQGRLVGVKDETGSMAVHRYDAVGNLLSIDNFTPTAGSVGIFLLLPEKGVVGENIDIQGFGFSNATTENTVTFNGTPATVVSANFGTLTVTVPVGATTGPVIVTNATGSATSPQPFTVLTTPKILGIDPNRLAQGTTNTTVITGVNLAGATTVTFNSGGLTTSILPGATSETLQISLVVAPSTTPGAYAFSVTTPTGLTQSGTITITVLPAVATFSTTQKGVSVFLPPPPDPVSPTGPAASSTPSPSVFLPPPLVPVSPSGPASSSTPGPSVFLPPPPDPVSPSGSSMSIAPPASVLMP